MAVAARIDPKTYFAPEEWAPLARRSPWKGLALLAHAWVGIRDVVLDYVRPLPLRLFLLSMIVLALALLGAWVVLIVVSHAL